MRQSEFRPITALAVVGLSVVFGAAACGQSEALIAVDNRDPGGFGSDRDASVDASAVPENVLMCPVTTCTPGRMTCPSSKFPCDVDLMTDANNCGACGLHCGDNQSRGRPWSCVGGECTFGCTGSSLDCDHDPTTGCEVDIGSDDNNCGDCGVKCPAGFSCFQLACINGCLEGNKPDTCNGICTNLGFDHLNCGTCGNACDPTGPNLPALPADLFYGCAYGACGNPACGIANQADCNGDLSDGCEATLHTSEHCGGCNDACAPGKECALTPDGTYACLCEDDNETLCLGQCWRLDDSPVHCGGCFRACPGLYLPHYDATCTHGVCGGKCADGYADCDGIRSDGINGCEVDTRVDNRHCGACGHACLPNQVCKGGQCLVAPCDAGSPEDPTR